MSTAPSPLVSIVTISYDPTASILKKQLAVLARQSLRDFEYILVDSGAQKLSAQVLKNSQLVTQVSTRTIFLPSLPPQQFNYADAYNTGIQKAQGEIIVRLSADAMPASPRWLQNLIRPLQNPPARAAKAQVQVGIVYGQVQKDSRPLANASEKKYPNSSFWLYSTYEKITHQLLQPPAPRSHQLFPFVTGACFAFRKKLWQQHPFNTHWRWGEEYEFTNFVQKQGLAIYHTPQVLTFHIHTLGFISGLKRIFRDLKLIWQVLILWAFGA